MNKEELINAIENLPLFRLRDVAVKDEVIVDSEVEKESWVEADRFKSVTETNKHEPYAFVSKGYQLVQFKEMFKPIVEKIGDCKGDINHYNGFAIMDVFPLKEEFSASKIGIVAYNSVDKTSALNIRFCVDYNGKKITIPKGVASFRKIHLGNVGVMTQDYISVITQIKKAWSSIIGKFTKEVVDDTNIGDVVENFDMDSYSLKHMKKKMVGGKTFDLWSFSMEVFDYLSKKKYKSEVHRRKRLDKFAKKIFDYGFLLNI
jgi:hypothetical protein